MLQKDFRDVFLFDCLECGIEGFMGLDDDFKTSWENGVYLVHIE